ncbi:MAG: hypothetical protein AAF581_19755 [Planctomycetota bacterium]
MRKMLGFVIFVAAVCATGLAGTVAGQPANDDCIAPVVVVLGASQPFDTTSATPDGQGLSCQIHRDLWFRMQAPSSGVLITTIVNNAGNPSDLTHAIYARAAPGGCPTDADLRSCLELPGGNSSGVSVIAGEFIFVRLGSWHSGAAPVGELTLTLQAAPAHDSCQAPLPIAVPGSAPFDTLAATPSTVDLDCARFESAATGDPFDDLWYVVTTAAEGALHVVADSTQAALAVYVEPQPGACPVAADLLQCAALNEAYVHAHPGASYLIRVGKSWSGTLQGNVSVSLQPLLANDECDAAVVVPVPSVTTFDAATAFASNNASCDVPQDLWYEVVAPSSGLLTVQIGGPGNPSSHAVYELAAGPGTCPLDPPLSCVSGQHPWDSVTPVLGGSSYAIRVGRWPFAQFPPAPGTELSIALEQGPSNDDCAAAQWIAAVPAVLPFDNLTASDDVNGLTCAFPKRDLWYRFTAPQTGSLEVVVAGATLGQTATFAAAHALYVDPGFGLPCPDDADLVLCTDFPDRSVVGVQAGTDYWLRIGSDLSGVRLLGEIALEYVTGAPDSVACDATQPGVVVGSYAIPQGNDYDLGVEVLIDDVVITTIAQTQLTYTHTLGVGFAGVVEIGFRGQNSVLGGSDVAACEAAVGGPPNNLCATAAAVGIGTHPFDNTITTLDPTVPPPTCGNQAGRDLWFLFTAPEHATFTAETCASAAGPGSNPGVFIEVWDASTGCPSAGTTSLVCSDSGCENGSRAVWAGALGVPYLVRVGGTDGATGSGVLTLDYYCAEIIDVVCDYDCFQQEAVLSWSADQTHQGYTLISDLDGVLGTTNTPFYATQQLSAGVHAITIEAACGNGATSAASCTLSVIDVAAFPDDLVVALEGTGATDSVATLLPLLVAEGREVTLLGRDFADHLCLDGLLQNVQAVWVLAGTFPNAYPLALEERNRLVDFAHAGVAIYLEGADLWGFDHVASNLDALDGIDQAVVDDGDDLTVLAFGVDTGVSGGNFEHHGQLSYSQDNLVGDDRTDRLHVGSGDIGITSGAALISPGGGVPDFPVVVLAHDDIAATRMLSSSWELGGIGDALTRVRIVHDYLRALGILELVDFVRGDADTSGGAVNIADAILVLNYLFPQGAPVPLGCADAADADASGSVNVADVVVILQSLFGFAPTPLPFPNSSDGCGAADIIGCGSYPACP